MLPTNRAAPENNDNNNRFHINFKSVESTSDVLLRTLAVS